MKILKALVVIILSIAGIVVMQRYFGQSTVPPRPSRNSETGVVVEVVAKRHFANRIEAIGTAQANEAITITSTVAERVRKILFENGAQVKQGDLLVQLDNEEEVAQCQEAHVDLVEQKREFGRIKNLREKKVVAAQAFDTQQSAVAMAEARLAAAEARLADRAISAPFSGVLGIRRVSPGALISPGTVITTLDDLSIIKVEFTIPETFLAELKLGQAIEAQSVVWPDETFKGLVRSIDSRINPTTRAVTVQAHIPNSDIRLRAGMLLTIELISRPRDSIGIPEKSLLAYADKQYVFVLPAKSNNVARREVLLGRREAGWVEIKEGLKEGEQIVTEELMDLRDGARVHIVSSN